MREYEECNKCILDTNDDSKIQFDASGTCNHCKDYEANVKKHYFGDVEGAFEELVAQIKKDGQGKKYDALIGISGGVDSSYVAYLCFVNGIRPLVVHLDNGWNSELSVLNVRNILKVTGFDLSTYVINWNEFKDLQKSYLKAHVIDIEVLTDHAIGALMTKMAVKHNIKYILSGSSITTEGRLPDDWIYNKEDSVNIRAIHKRFGTRKLSTFPFLGYPFRSWTRKLHGIKMIDILDYIKYDKPEAKKHIQEYFSWRDYRGKHFESVFTRFYQAYILPKKFKVDKRKSHLSMLICANQLTREKALKLMDEPLYPSPFMEKMDKMFFLKKMDLTEQEFDEYIQAKEISHEHYPNIMVILKTLSKIKQAILKRIN